MHPLHTPTHGSHGQPPNAAAHGCHVSPGAFLTTWLSVAAPRTAQGNRRPESAPKLILQSRILGEFPLKTFFLSKGPNCPGLSVPSEKSQGPQCASHWGPKGTRCPGPEPTLHPTGPPPWCQPLTLKLTPHAPCSHLQTLPTPPGSPVPKAPPDVPPTPRLPGPACSTRLWCGSVRGRAVGLTPASCLALRSTLTPPLQDREHPSPPHSPRMGPAFPHGPVATVELWMRVQQLGFCAQPDHAATDLATDQTAQAGGAGEGLLPNLWGGLSGSKWPPIPGHRAAKETCPPLSSPSYPPAAPPHFLEPSPASPRARRPPLWVCTSSSPTLCPTGKGQWALQRQTPLPTSLQNTTCAGHPLLDVLPSPDESFYASSSSQTAACLHNMNHDKSKASDSRMGCSKALGSTQSRAAPALPDGDNEMN